jgi:hypothetical protein
MPQHSILVASFPGDGRTEQSVADWIAELFLLLSGDQSVGRVTPWHPTVKGNRLIGGETPVTMLRNRCLLDAERKGFDFVLMIDNDMDPDCVEGAPGFWETAWPFAKNHLGPCVIAAPYCGPPPVELVYVSKWHKKEMGHPGETDFAMGLIPRGEATRCKGIERVAAIGTGLMLIDVRAIKKLPHPRFYYVWTDHTESEKHGTEDIVFTRDLNLLGIPVYCAWDCWAAHIKKKRVMPPQEIPIGNVPAWLVERAKQLAEEGRAGEQTGGKHLDREQILARLNGSATEHAAAGRGGV